MDRAVSMIEALAPNDRLSATQLSELLETGKATAFRLARTLVARGWLVQNDDRSYQLGPGLLGLAGGSAGPDLGAELRPLLADLRDRTGETIHLTRLDGRHVVYLEQLMSPQSVLSVAMIGSRSPAHCVSPGLAQLAHLSPERLAWVLSAPPERFTENTLTDPALLREELARVRDRGYAINVGGYRPDVGGVGSAVIDVEGNAIAGLSVCVPVYRLHRLDVHDLGELLRATAVDAARRVELAG
ncbi:IclR family transcriptional regulator [Pseudonocardia parietis]|uniref:DNA-binding IclR family transcriptional regulator n=1 Tax=Pseudonocardia parietis TaxID=570936 RepID=A0ABS4VMG5_9PSEU|nr:IclR family transcriptional regulator [Pseudonocardia parietis]MBP2365121.1 DNA-binding IclR family transcriptional regulator [Pseudonocardia parietis]